MTFTSTVPGMMKVTCNGGCGTELHQTPENKGINLLDFMRSAGWAIGPNVCPPCQGAPAPAGRDTPGPPQARRRRKIRKLV